jgi:hypothetical protein
MQPQYLVRARRFSLGALLLVGLASLSAFGGETSAEADRNALSLGTVTVLGPATCLSGSTKGGACTSISVSCPGVPDLTATLSEAFPTGTATGTIILLSGGDGTHLLQQRFCQRLSRRRIPRGATRLDHGNGKIRAASG